MKRTKCTRGFTLLEVVISVAALSLVGVFLLQMFLSAASLNERARNADVALTLAAGAIESGKAGGTVPDPSAYPLYYDQDWQLQESEYGARFAFSVTVNKDDAVPGLYVLLATVTDLDAQNRNRILAVLQAKQYVSSEGGAPDA